MGASLGGGKSSSSSQNSSKSESNPLTAEEVQSYFDQLNQNSGGRLDNWAQAGTTAVNYTPLTEHELAAIGGAGATRRNETNRLLDNQLDQIQDDASLTVAQRTRAQQLANESAANTLDGINKEVEASMSALLSQDRLREYEASRQNSLIPREDLETLAAIYFGGKGQKSTSESQGSSSSSSWNVNAGIGLG